MNENAILVSSVPDIIYLTGFSGFSETEREAIILINRNKKYLITDKRYSPMLDNLKGFEILDCGASNFIANPKTYLKKVKILNLEIDLNNITVNEYLKLKKHFKLKKSSFNITRMIKTPDEIKKIKKACNIGDEAFSYILSEIKTGITEIQISNLLINFFKSRNSDMSFKPIIAFGKNSAVPHHQNTNIKLKKNQVILMDFGVKYQNYCSDITRTIFFGKPNNKFLKMYSTTLNAQAEAINFVNQTKNNNKMIKLSDIDKASREYILKNGFDSIPHSLGHGIGIEVHESPNISPASKGVLKNNMIFSIEPGIYIKNFCGVRIEDLVLVKNNKLELISHANREIIIIND